MMKFLVLPPAAGLAAVVALCSASGHAAPPSARAIDQVTEEYLARREVRALTKPLTQREALFVQQGFVKRLQPKLGRPIGHKVGLVTREAQQRFNTDGPVRGVLLERMMLYDGADVPADFGVHPIFEADLVVIVKDKGINRARSIIEAAEHLRDVAAFIELPDAMLPTNPPPNAARLTAVNVGARFGVIGQRVAVQSTASFVQALAQMKVTVTDDTGALLGQGQGKDILDHPLNALLWLMEDLRKSGEQLKAGDIISLGSIKALPIPAGKIVTVRYDGLPGGPIQAVVRFGPKP